MKLSKVLCLCGTSLSAAIIFVEGEGEKISTCRTRFSFDRPTRENVLSILFGGREPSGAERSVSFNHDEIGISQPVSSSSNIFPLCKGYPKKKKRHLIFHEHLESGITDDGDDTTILCSSANANGWRVLRFHKRVGNGRQCYRRVQNAVLNWDFEERIGKKSMGILSATPKPQLDVRLADQSIPGSTKPRRSFMATFTEIYFSQPWDSLFVVNPVHVVYEVKDAHTPQYKFSSTAYATLSGHLLSGEERVSVIWRRGRGEAVDVEIVSFSRSTESLGGKLIWPLIGRMQKQFFISEIEHLDKVAKAKT